MRRAGEERRGDLPLLRRRLRDPGLGAHAAARRLPVSHHSRAVRCGRRDHAVELAAHHGCAESRAGARSGQCCHPEAVRADAFAGAGAWARRTRGGPAARCVERAARNRSADRRCAGRASGRAHGVVYRRHRERQADRRRRSRQADAGRTGAGRQVAAHRLRGCRHRDGRGARSRAGSSKAADNRVSPARGCSCSGACTIA